MIPLAMVVIDEFREGPSKVALAQRAAHAMPDIPERASDPRVAPGRILVRHPNDQPANLGEYIVPARARVRIHPLPRSVKIRGRARSHGLGS